MPKKNLSFMWQRARKLRKKATLEERILWAQLKNKELFPCAFRRQFVIGNYIADFYCHSEKLIIELDGSQHADEKMSQKDRERTLFFNEQKIRVVRFWNDEIRNDLSNVIDYLLHIVERK